MAFSTIDKSSSLMNTVLYSGNSSTQAITGVGFQPDWCWFKGRNFADNHVSIDAVRGTNKAVYPDTTGAETTQTHYFTSFDSDGYTLGNSGIMNLTGRTYASWNWKANGAGVLNEVGDIDSTVSVNNTSGFSIVKFTGTNSNATVGHGMSVAPSLIIIKNLGTTEAWGMGGTALNNWNNYISLNSDDGWYNDVTMWNDTAPTSSVFTVGTGNITNDTELMIAYCFAEVPGYSKFGSYEGNSSTNGHFVYTGFKPSLVIQKQTSSAGEYWMMKDNKRNLFNPTNLNLYPNATNTEVDTNGIDLLSNGFKMRTSGAGSNHSGETYIYIAFGQPLISNSGVCATAR